MPHFRPTGSTHAYDGHVSAIDCFNRVIGGREASAFYCSGNKLVELTLHDWRSARTNQIDLGINLVCALIRDEDLMRLLRSVAAVGLILAALSACGGGEGIASDGVLPGNSGTTTSSGRARLLFSSGFEGSIALSAPSLYGNGAWQDIVGTDSTTGYTWPGNIWGGGIRSQMIVGAPVNGYDPRELHG